MKHDRFYYLDHIKRVSFPAAEPASIPSKV